MKRFIPILLLLCACHTRKAIITKTDSVATIQVSMDSIHTAKKVDSNSFHAFTLNTDSTVIIGTGTLSVSGNSTVITGTYHYAKAVKKEADTSNNNFIALTDHSEIKSDSTANVVVKKTTKQISHPFNWWVLTALIPIAIGFYFKFKKK